MSLFIYFICKKNKVYPENEIGSLPIQYLDAKQERGYIEDDINNTNNKNTTIFKKSYNNVFPSYTITKR